MKRSLSTKYRLNAVGPVLIVVMLWKDCVSYYSRHARVDLCVQIWSWPFVLYHLFDIWYYLIFDNIWYLISFYIINIVWYYSRHAQIDLCVQIWSWHSLCCCNSVIPAHNSFKRNKKTFLLQSNHSIFSRKAVGHVIQTWKREKKHLVAMDNILLQREDWLIGHIKT